MLPTSKNQIRTPKQHEARDAQAPIKLRRDWWTLVLWIAVIGTAIFDALLIAGKITI